eukprot:COSAG04_NODE_10043_length_810_cov_1.579466_1_plen_145_part_10
MLGFDSLIGYAEPTFTVSDEAPLSVGITYVYGGGSPNTYTHNLPNGAYTVSTLAETLDNELSSQNYYMQTSAGGAEQAAASALVPPALTDAEQHDFLNLARDFDWDGVRTELEASPTLVNVTLSGRWPALHQAAHAQDPKAVEML